MAQEVKIILDLSDQAQAFLEKQQVNIYDELKREIPSLRLTVEADPAAPKGSRDLTTIILAVATLVSSITPLIIHILNQYTPANHMTHWQIEETETRNPDGTVIVQRKRIQTSEEQRPWISPPSQDNLPSKTSTPATTSNDQI